jgi:hypothetical protein
VGGLNVAALVAKSAVKKAAPVKKAATTRARKPKDDMPTGRPVGTTVGMAAVCKTSGCANQGVRQTFRVPALGRIALLPGGVMCLVCERRMQVDLDDVVVERVEGGK